MKVASLVALTISACGGEAEPRSTNQSAVVYGDCSGFRTVSTDYLPEMITFAEAIAQAQMTLRYACVDGAPLRTVRFEEADFAEVPEQIEANVGLVDRFNRARALGLRDKFAAMLQQQPQVSGSGQLEALELAAREPDLVALAFWTDAISNAVEDVDNLQEATEENIQTVIKRWVPRMENGLNGATVYFIGVGRDTASSAALRNAEKLFRGVVEGAGGTLVWRENLPSLTEEQ